jgi:hypothetical protein
MLSRRITHASAARQKWRAPCSSLCKGRDTFGVSAACTCWLDASGLHGPNPLTHYRFRDFTPTTAARQSALSTEPSKLTRQPRHNASGALAITPTAWALSYRWIDTSQPDSPSIFASPASKRRERRETVSFRRGFNKRDSPIATSNFNPDRWGRSQTRALFLRPRTQCRRETEAPGASTARRPRRLSSPVRP